jgi:hypothetical protein
MTVSYGKLSPYSNTTTFDKQYLDIMTVREIPRLPDDILFTINKTYEYRPDNLAFDLYGDARLWWIFAMRNKNTLIDPIWDFKTGVSIYLPKKISLMSALGV